MNSKDFGERLKKELKKRVKDKNSFSFRSESWNSKSEEMIQGEKNGLLEAIDVLEYFLKYYA